MTPKIITIPLILSALLYSCSFDRDANAVDVNRKNQQIKTVEIQLFPAFNNSSYILIDKVSKTIYFRVDTTKKYRGVMPQEYKTNLDSFERNTLIDSFYSSNFLDSIKLMPENWGARDGLSIYTVINRENRFDTIKSGNVYPKILSTNIISQINYISKNTKDTLLKNYIEDLKTYFQ